MLSHLKIEVKSLAHRSLLARRAEKQTLEKAQTFKANALREEENKYREEDSLRSVEEYNRFWGLHRFRTHTIRKEARATQLAYGFLKGREYTQMETSCYENPDWTRIEKIIVAHAEEDPRVVMQRFAEWLAKAKQVAA